MGNRINYAASLIFSAVLNYLKGYSYLLASRVVADSLPATESREVAAFVWPSPFILQLKVLLLFFF